MTHSKGFWPDTNWGLYNYKVSVLWPPGGFIFDAIWSLEYLSTCPHECQCPRDVTIMLSKISFLSEEYFGTYIHYTNIYDCHGNWANSIIWWRPWEVGPIISFCICLHVNEHCKKQIMLHYLLAVLVCPVIMAVQTMNTALLYILKKISNQLIDKNWPIQSTMSIHWFGFTVYLRAQLLGNSTQHRLLFSIWALFPSCRGWKHT